MSPSLSGRTALITGSTSGIGRASADALAKLGANLIISGRVHDRGHAAVEQLRAGGAPAEFVAADLSTADSAQGLAAAAQETGLGPVDILVNNAAGFAAGPTSDTPEAAFDQVYDVNVKAPFFLVGALAPGMVERGRGAIINITTMAAGFGVPGMALYGSSKAALVLLTKAWAAEYGSSGVRVNAVSPGPTRTEGTAPFGEMLDQQAAGSPAGRPAGPEEIASAVAYLASDEASYVHGAVLSVDGGRSAI